MLFDKQEQLAEFLGGIQPNYSGYAAKLWLSGVTSADELANASVQALLKAGITNRVHAENVKAKAAAGEVINPGLITCRRLLCSALPRASSNNQASSTPSSRRHLCSPEEVSLWERVRFDGGISIRLTDAIIKHQDSADDTESCMPLPPRDISAALGSETEVASALKSFVADYLTRLAQRLPNQEQAAWHQEASHAIMQHGVASSLGQASSLHVPQPASGTAAPSTGQYGRPLSKRTPLPSLSTSADHKRIKCDLVLMCSSGAGKAPAAETATQSNQSSIAAGHLNAGSAATACSAGPELLAGIEQQYACVGEVKIPVKLMELADNQLQPMDLLEAWHADDVRGRHAKAAIDQTYTYMQVLGVCYGYITCWFTTWLVFCPHDSRKTLYLSAPFTAESQHRQGCPTATTMGALSWLQEQALSSPRAVPARLLGFGSGNAGSGNAEDNNSDETDKGAKSGSQDQRNPASKGRQQRRGKGANKAQSSRSSHGNKAGAGQQQQQQLARYSCASPVGLCLRHKIGNGSAGAVLAGSYRAAEAVVKLLGPDSSGLAAFAQECGMYAKLQRVQGQLVPALLAAGHLAAGVHFIATQRVDGVPLSSLSCIQPVVAAAALDSFRSLVAAFPGFLHGDVRLANVVLLTGGSDTTPRCMWIDFARSKMDASKEQQEAEEALLNMLLGL